MPAGVLKVAEGLFLVASFGLDENFKKDAGDRIAFKFDDAIAAAVTFSKLPSVSQGPPLSAIFSCHIAHSV